jgi:hypothetical protein
MNFRSLKHIWKLIWIIQKIKERGTVAMGYTRCGAWPSRWKWPGPIGPLAPRWNRGAPPPHFSLAHGSPGESGRPAASGWGRSCQRASPGGEGPDLGHRQRRGSPWRAHYDEVGRHWRTGDGRPEKRWMEPAQGSWRDGELRRRSLRWRRSTLVAGGGTRREGGLGKWRRRLA